MKKVLSIILSLTMVFAMSVTAFAAEPKAEILTDVILQAMTPQDFISCYDYLLQYKQENPTCSNDQLDEIASNFYINTYNSRGNTLSPASWYTF